MSDISRYGQIVNGPSREDLFDGLRLRDKQGSLQTFTILKDEGSPICRRMKLVTPILGIVTPDADSPYSISWNVKILVGKEPVWISYCTATREGDFIREGTTQLDEIVS